MITSFDMKKLELTANMRGISNLVLMENAGKACADVIYSEYDLHTKKVLVVCGHGNNGGDGFVIARYLKKYEFDADVLFVGDENKFSNETKHNLELFKSAYPTNLIKKVDWQRYNFIVDALFGTGLTRDVSEPFYSLIKDINKKKRKDAKVISIDVPSGIDANLGKVLGISIDPDLIIALHDIKPGVDNKKTVVVAIGLEHIK